MYSNGVQSVISVRDVVKRFAGITALDHVSLDFYPGEVHCLVGRERRRQIDFDESTRRSL